MTKLLTLDTETELLGFSLEGQRFALALAAIERIVPVVEITPLPQAPLVIAGFVVVEGAVLPVLSLRRRFGFPDRDLTLGDRLIITRTQHRRLLLLVDHITGILHCPAGALTSSQDLGTESGYLAGVAQLPDGIWLIGDLDRFLSLEEEREIMLDGLAALPA